MDLVTYNANIYLFLIISLLVWFLSVLYALNLWVFFFFTELVINLKYFNFFFTNPSAGFIVLYLLFCLYLTAIVSVFQFSLFFIISGLNQTNNSYFDSIQGSGSVINGFETVCLYLPVLVSAPNAATTTSLQFFVNALSITLVFVFFNSFL